MNNVAGLFDPGGPATVARAKRMCNSLERRRSPSFIKKESASISLIFVENYHFSKKGFPSLAFSESPRYEMCSIAPNKLHNNFKLSYAEGVSYVVQSSHLKIKRSSNLTGILPKTF